jgi:hypothetical protein
VKFLDGNSGGRKNGIKEGGRNKVGEVMAWEVDWNKVCRFNCGYDRRESVEVKTVYSNRIVVGRER